TILRATSTPFWSRNSSLAFQGMTPTATLYPLHASRPPTTSTDNSHVLDPDLGTKGECLWYRGPKHTVNRTRHFTIASFLVAIPLGIGAGRAVPFWTYDDLNEASDVVTIALPLETVTLKTTKMMHG